ncbi:uncharacterized protein K452DRAFT_147793 [Aplosporella prunicola CBS 121167]|uniref:Secreted protein n=1 Tax=Aplosporella prunicola CBS 121167 TaxID=1176127 RepID=A0A6A6BL33_9PEZI|nr:uncharacterized protein K452DRAFT_147793 [Aplosporella prunicola CBS 121167]KAF2144819.1 hypothetical protein K452DRAFT_147793 [Aplosporella prunicola CBS 121167]
MRCLLLHMLLYPLKVLVAPSHACGGHILTLVLSVAVIGLASDCGGCLVFVSDWRLIGCGLPYCDKLICFS